MGRSSLAAALLAGVLVGAACTAPAAPAAPAAPEAGAPSVSEAMASIPDHCAYRRTAGGDPLPDQACTPGAADPRVTPQNVGATICQRGYTSTVRPPVSYTDALKTQLMRRYGATGSPSQYELDHLVPLELGGAPSDAHNLWPEPGGIPNPKDRVENGLNKLVCNGRLGLAEAQQAIRTDWAAAGQRYLGSAP
jgi:hypothetical protein